MSNSAFTEFWLAREGALKKTKREQDWHSYDEKPWPIYGSDAQSYAETFLPVLPEGSFDQLVANWEKPGLIMEPFGEGSFIRSLLPQPDDVHITTHRIVGGLAMTLVDVRNQSDKGFDEQNRIKMIAGDFYHGKNHREIRVFLEQNQSIGFKLIVCRPILGWELSSYESPSLSLIWITIKKLFNYLDVNGELFISLPANIYVIYSVDCVLDTVWRVWSENCKKNNVVVSYDQDNGLLRIKKLSTDSVLPRIGI